MQTASENNSDHFQEADRRECEYVTHRQDTHMWELLSALKEVFQFHERQGFNDEDSLLLGLSVSQGNL